MSEEPTDDPELVAAVNEIVYGEAETINVEAVFAYAFKIGIMLSAWRKSMVDAGFPPDWVEKRCTTLFEKFFQPNWGQDGQG